MPITTEYVDKRFAQFVAKHAVTLQALGYEEARVQKDCRNLELRLRLRDFKLYGSNPIHALHGGKRITRFLVKSAIEHRPAARARRERLYQEYCERAREIRKSQPFASFFSFEAVYAKQLRVNLLPFKKMFYI